uniref:hypothetical protein n=1 Tax=Cronobacter sakazakii TaxID=28141 RepID=UPI001F3ECFDD
VFTAVPVNDVAVTMTTNNSPADGSTVNAAQALVTSASGQPMPVKNLLMALTRYRYASGVSLYFVALLFAG